MKLLSSVPPHLGPLVFPSGTRAGMRAQSSCFVQEGDLPMEIYWEKDGSRFESAGNVKVNRMDDFTSILSITDAHAGNSGNYSCIARNTAGSVSTSALLSVNGDTKVLSHFLTNVCMKPLY